MKEFTKLERQLLEQMKENLGEAEHPHLRSIADSQFMDRELLRQALSTETTPVSTVRAMAKDAGTLFVAAYLRAWSRLLRVQYEDLASRVVNQNTGSDLEAHFSEWLLSEGLVECEKLSSISVDSADELAMVIRALNYHGIMLNPASKADGFELQSVLSSVREALKAITPSGTERSL